ncbi:DSBA-like thioredoxin domain protein [Novipirellula galeiformis]|uniref:DSBA-like thioredoxin domain protein n=1 Tax=Novipirellula galeiformis TaxID=2528004 RepID=A0A5C6CGF7_9BACT|nr:DsbA family oxidoreductase [Novipirellula galeiformis]TWU23398.1 DSBA-like thioredoxin domain protein [Novipirellula galeiformis]
MSQERTVDVISDVICPWCYIGKRRLEQAIATFDRPQDVRVRWHPFELNPAMPKEGILRKQYRTQKFGSWERSLELDAKLSEVGEAEGIHFAFGKMERTPNTVDAHRLIWLADQHACQDAVVEALFQAYFTDALDISDRPTVIDVVAGAGLDRNAAETLLSGDQAMDVIVSAKERSQRYGVEGVPFFIIDQKITLSGAQPAETFLEALCQTNHRE